MCTKEGVESLRILPYIIGSSVINVHAVKRSMAEIQCSQTVKSLLQCSQVAQNKFLPPVTCSCDYHVYGSVTPLIYTCIMVAVVKHIGVAMPTRSAVTPRYIHSSEM